MSGSGHVQASGSGYEARTRLSEGAFSAARRSLPTGVSRQTLVYRPYPLFAERGQAQYLWDVDGNRYLDLVNNYTSLIHGHAYPPSVEAAVAQLHAGGALGAPTRLELEFAELLRHRFPVVERLRFALSGTEAVMYALRVARAHTGRQRVLKFEGGFHGGHDEVQYNIAHPPMAAGTFRAGEPNSAGLLDLPTLVAVYNDVESVEAAFAAHGEEIAAVIAEPFLGNAGLVAAAPDFLNRVKEIAHAHGALFVLDEIQSMRLTEGGAQRIHQVTPDIVTLGKIMGGGLPLAAFGGASHLMDALDGFAPEVPQTGTFNAFSASLAAGLATMQAFDRDAVARLNREGERLRAGVRRVFRDRDIPVTVNGQGSMFNVIVSDAPVTTYREWRQAPTELWSAVRMRLLAAGMYITARGTGCLSTAMSGYDVDTFLEALADAVAGAKRDKESAR
ncbi:aspartate aminotransferase family protein [Microbispora siamensis]|uniref:Aspartate aminotransferase family protein n=1 Tax=Microbispora siamensis TaxID=564413 RepID=A0ABQ4GRT0_9ACTN|nr:aspartate aminotransferase family protein [Microbispora siamensis]GIH64126.1 aspartate aminotransferase family protein [Microbispora siamensis]